MSIKIVFPIRIRTEYGDKTVVIENEEGLSKGMYTAANMDPELNGGRKYIEFGATL